MKFSLTSKLTSNLMFGLLATSVLMGCRAGIVPSASSINLDDSKAPFLVEKSYEDTPGHVVRPEWREGADPQVVKALREQLQDLELLLNPQVQADFKSLQKTITVTADIQLTSETRVAAQFVGSFLMDGKAYLRDPKLPFVVIIAQCLEDCRSLLLHTVLMDKKDNKTVLLTDQTIAELEKSAPASAEATPDFTPQRAKEKSKQPDFSADLAGVGNYPPPVIDPKELAGLVPRAEYERAQATGAVSAHLSQTTVSTPPPVLKLDQVIGTGIVLGEISDGSGIKLNADLAVDFPLPLPQEFTGQAEGCYAVFRDQTNAKSCSKGGSLSLANQIPQEGSGYKRYAQASHSYASGLAFRFIQVLSDFHSKTWTGMIMDIGNVAAQAGGLLRFSSGRGAHTSHQNGLEVDIQIPFKNAPKLSGKFSGISAATDYERLWGLVKYMGQMSYFANGQALPIINRVYLDKRHILKLCPLAKADPANAKAVLLLQHIEGHTTHLHVRLEATPHNPSARIVIVNPAANVCGI